MNARLSDPAIGKEQFGIRLPHELSQRRPERLRPDMKIISIRDALSMSVGQQDQRNSHNPAEYA
jgi:hypothetical protein